MGATRFVYQPADFIWQWHRINIAALAKRFEALDKGVFPGCFRFHPVGKLSEEFDPQAVFAHHRKVAGIQVSCSQKNILEQVRRK